MDEQGWVVKITVDGLTPCDNLIDQVSTIARSQAANAAPNEPPRAMTLAEARDPQPK